MESVFGSLAMPNFMVGMLTNLQSLDLVHSCIPINLLSVDYVIDIFMLGEFMVAHCDKASNTG